MVASALALRGVAETIRVGDPHILERYGSDFLEGLLSELADAGGMASAMRSRTQTGPGGMRLFQPIHRVFHVVLLEVGCGHPWGPRLDPARIVEAGMVLRRVAVSQSGQLLSSRLEGWMEEAPTPRSRDSGAERMRLRRGWERLQGQVGGTPGELDRDPDPDHRPPPIRTGHPALDHRAALGGPAETLAERVAPLFVVPPDVIKATGKTLLYGLVPVTSSEVSEAPASLPAFDDADLADHLPGLLKQSTVPQGGGTLTVSSVLSTAADAARRSFLRDLRQVAVEFDALGPSNESKAVRSAFNRLSVTIDGDSTPLGEFLAEAVRVFLDEAQAGDSLAMPSHWPNVSTSDRAAIVSAVGASMRARLSRTISRPGRFDDASREYRLRTFVRVRSQRDCPPELVWSEHTAPFKIAPWYEASDQPPSVIQLPNAFDRDTLRSLKPNVAFAVPEKLQAFLQANSPKDLMDGEASEGSGIALGWICSFSLPIITFCAFIVLNIFLGLFDFFFRWLLYIKVCIPVPKPK